jgi:hypothetical protein
MTCITSRLHLTVGPLWSDLAHGLILQSYDLVGAARAFKDGLVSLMIPG